MKALLIWVATVLGVALLAHLGSTWYLPRYIMDVAMDTVAAEGGVNAVQERPLADADARSIVRPSPSVPACAPDTSTSSKPYRPAFV